MKYNSLIPKDMNGVEPWLSGITALVCILFNRMRHWKLSWPPSSPWISNLNGGRAGDWQLHQPPMALDRLPGPVDSSTVKQKWGVKEIWPLHTISSLFVYWTQIYMYLLFHWFLCGGLGRLGQDLFTTQFPKSQSRHSIVGATRKGSLERIWYLKEIKVSTLREKLWHLFYFELLMDGVSYSFQCLWPWKILIQLDFSSILKPLAKSGTCFTSLTVCFL